MHIMITYKVFLISFFNSLELVLNCTLIFAWASKCKRFISIILLKMDNVIWLRKLRMVKIDIIFFYFWICLVYYRTDRLIDSIYNCSVKVSTENITTTTKQYGLTSRLRYLHLDRYRELPWTSVTDKQRHDDCQLGHTKGSRQKIRNNLGL